MKNRFKHCDKCNEETRHTFKRRFAHKGRSQSYHNKRDVLRCCVCGFTQVKNKTKGSYTKRMGGRNDNR